MEKEILKSNKVYKRANVLGAVIAVLFFIVSGAGLITGIASSENTDRLYRKYTVTNEYQAIYNQDMTELGKEYKNNQISKEKYDEKVKYISSSNMDYVRENLSRSESEIKEKIEKSDKLTMYGISGAILGIVGAVGTGIIANRKEEKNENENENN